MAGLARVRARVRAYEGTPHRLTGGLLAQQPRHRVPPHPKQGHVCGSVHGWAKTAFFAFSRWFSHNRDLRWRARRERLARMRACPRRLAGESCPSVRLRRCRAVRFHGACCAKRCHRAIGKTGCLNTLTGSRGAFACLSPSGAHSDILFVIWMSLWPYWMGSFVYSTRGEF